MKKNSIVLGIAVISAALAAAYPVYAAQEDVEDTAGITMEEIINANTRENLLKYYDNYLVEIEEHSSGGYLSFYGDQKLRYADYGEEQEAYLENGSGYQHTAEDDIYAGILYSYDPDLTAFDNPVFDYEPTLKEHIVATKTEDEKLIVTTELTPDDTKIIMESSGYEYTEGDYVGYEYIIEKDTCILHASEGTLYHADGSSEQYASLTLETDIERPDTAQELYNRLTSTDLRTVTIILNPETEEEVSYSASAVKGDAVLYVMTDGYSHLYTDKECKEEFNGSNDKTKDIVLYSVPDEEK